MRELKLTKVLTAKGSYKYAADSARHAASNTLKINTAIADAIVKVDYALNNIVIKTFPGLAQAVASGVDSLHLETILGCVGGDDTIIVVTVDEASARELSEKISELMKVF
jgi:transcriptional regulator of arginine metabolism